MPRRPSRRHDEREARIHWILDEAFEVVESEGLAALTTTGLAQRLGYTAPAFYRYFASKDALLVALEARTAERFYAVFFESLTHARVRLAAGKNRPRPRVVALAELLLLVHTYAALSRTHAAHFRVVTALTTGQRSWIQGEAAEQLRMLVFPRVMEVIAYFQRAEAAGALSPGVAATRALTLWVSLHAAIAAAPMASGHPGLFDPEALRQDLVRTLLLGWGAEANVVDEASAWLSGVGDVERGAHHFLGEA